MSLECLLLALSVNHFPSFRVKYIINFLQGRKKTKSIMQRKDRVRFFTLLGRKGLNSSIIILILRVLKNHGIIIALTISPLFITVTFTGRERA